MNETLSNFLNIINNIIIKFELKPLSDDGRFVYIPLLCNNLAIKYHISTSSAKVLIIDKLSGYFNATLFVQAYSDTDTKRFTTASSTYKQLSKIIYDDINKPLDELRHRRSLCLGCNPEETGYDKQELDMIIQQKNLITQTTAYNKNLDVFVVDYNIIAPYPKPCRGVYVHPGLFTEIVSQANLLMFLDMGLYGLCSMISNITVDNTPRIELSKFKKYHEYPDVYIKKVTKRQSKIKPQKTIKDQLLTVLVKANYDTAHQYGDTEYKLNLLLVPSFEAQEYINAYDLKPRDVSEEQLYDMSFESEIVYSVPSLQNVPINFVDIFYEDYKVYVDMEYVDGYILTREFKEFTEYLSDYLLEFMLI